MEGFSSFWTILIAFGRSVNDYLLQSIAYTVAIIALEREGIDMAGFVGVLVRGREYLTKVGLCQAVTAQPCALPQSRVCIPSIHCNRLLNSLAIGAVMLWGAHVACAQQVSLVWSDEFNGASVDLTKWTFDLGNGAPGNPGWGNNEFEYYTSSTNNAYVTNGFLHIRAVQQTTITNISGTIYTNRYTSARMKTQGLFTKKFGRIEWRAKLPAGTGMWPALWSLGTVGGWPSCGEIDVVENNGANTNFVQGSLHWGGDTTGITNFTGGDSVTNFHVYGLDWTSNSISWSVDGYTYQTQTPVSNFTTWPFYFLMNLAVGGNYVGNPSTNSINPNLPAEMLIDYMRVYDYIASTNPPTTPTGLMANPGGSSVGLSWNVSSNAANYNVKRASVSGGPYTIIATPTANSYTDPGLVSCATYYYVVSASNSFGVSSNSIEASATLGSYSIAVNSGGSAAGQFIADTNVSGGTVAAPTGSAIDTSAVTNPAPQAVYQTERYGTFTYTFGGLTTGTSYKVRLHLVEYYWNSANARKFNVTINGSLVLSNYDVFVAAGGQNKAICPEFMSTPNGSGQIVIAYTPGTVDQPKSSGIEIILPAPTAPTGLAPTASDGQVALAWNAVSGASGYNLKRATTSGGPYTAVTNGLISATYTNTSLVNGTTYYYVVSTLKGGCESANSAEVSATPQSAFSAWQMQYFGCTACPQAAANADPDGDGQNNMAEFLSGTNPTNSASVFRVVLVATTGNDVVVTWQAGGGTTNVVQSTSGAGDGYATNFIDISPLITIPGTVDVVTNYPDLGAATNGPAEFYRIRLAP